MITITKINTTKRNDMKTKHELCMIKMKDEILKEMKIDEKFVTDSLESTGEYKAGYVEAVRNLAIILNTTN